MTFNYPSLSTTTFNGQRWYVTPNGNAYPSVTSVLGGTMSAEKEKSLENWRQSLGVEKAKQVSKNACDNGTVLHTLIERYLKGEELFTPIPGYEIQAQNKAALNAIKQKLDKIEEIWCIEESMYSDILELAGRCDCVGVYKGRPCIIDFKTAGRIKNDKDIEDYKYQLAAYAIMHNELFGTSIEHGTILMVADSGFPLEFNFDLVPFFEPLYERVQLFYQKLNQKLKIA
jgi:ATP-dependent exoDNAse (exonuclease V) beta subunit